MVKYRGLILTIKPHCSIFYLPVAQLVTSKKRLIIFFCDGSPQECEQAEPKTCVGDRLRHMNGRGSASDSRAKDNSSVLRVFYNSIFYLPVAQLDSASDSDSEGRRFKSFRVGQKFDKFRLVEFFIHCESNGISSRVSVYLIRFDEYISSKRIYHSNLSIKLVKYLSFRHFAKIDKFRQGLVDFYFFTIHFSLFTFPIRLSHLL